MLLNVTFLYNSTFVLILHYYRKYFLHFYVEMTCS
uniref:Uncharacterized protein n=1 Tax=Lepeophtheirus salmonis TaxID=72036 RepID=A0A0K2U3M2_LEPSM